MSRRLGVGFVGAGPVTQAIHLPTIATLGDRLQVTNIMDVDSALADRVAGRAGATASTSVEQLLEDDSTDVVVICSPHGFHAEQVVAACSAGKKAVLCEKPLATTAQGARSIADVAAATGVPVVVGAMHAFDPAWTAARQSWGDLAATATLVRSTILLPTNDEFVALATDLVVTGEPATAPLPQQLPVEMRRSLLTGALLGLATHAIPQLRQFMPKMGRLVEARILRPAGYHLVLTDEDLTVELTAVLPGEWSHHWTLEAWGGDQELLVRYPPSYVLAGSATAVLRGPAEERAWRFAENGYQAEWAHVADVAEGRVPLRFPVTEAVDDLVYALDIADAATGLLDGVA